MCLHCQWCKCHFPTLAIVIACRVMCTKGGDTIGLSKKFRYLSMKLVYSRLWHNPSLRQPINCKNPWILASTNSVCRDKCHNPYPYPDFITHTLPYLCYFYAEFIYFDLNVYVNATLITEKLGCKRNRMKLEEFSNPISEQEVNGHKVSDEEIFRSVQDMAEAVLWLRLIRQSTTVKSSRVHEKASWLSRLLKTS